MSDILAAALRRYPSDEIGRMLGSPALRAGGRCYAFVAGDDLILKLPAARVAELVAGGAGRPCSPRPGRPMREWVRVQPDLSYVVEARTFVAGPSPG
ncbi:hypothetical protein GCM10009827_006520 [Dactylosporangium maewongense]|uniref:TfoX N-terminal domain-containing protein n=1 Tax=Dactylosporangium maewongense TaxID=634393 RepID=A0ABN1ZKU9_9ACTN